MKEILMFFWLLFVLLVWWGGHYQVIQFFDILFETQIWCYEFYDVQDSYDYTDCDVSSLATVSFIVAVINANLIVASGVLTNKK